MLKFVVGELKDAPKPVRIYLEIDPAGEVAIMCTNGELTATIAILLTDGQLCLVESTPTVLKKLGFVVADNHISTY